VSALECSALKKGWVLAPHIDYRLGFIATIVSVTSVVVSFVGAGISE
jgi:hypothetical protein